MVTVDSANIRENAGTSFDILAKAELNDEFAATGNIKTASNNKDWYEIYLDGSDDTGWICSEVSSFYASSNINDTTVASTEDTTSEEDDSDNIENSTSVESDSNEEDDSDDTANETSSESNLDDEDESGDGTDVGNTANVSGDADSDNTRLSDDEVSSKIASLVDNNENSSKYNAKHYWRSKILHIVIALFIGIILLWIVCSIKEESVFWYEKICFLLAAAVLIAWGVFCIKDNSEYKYKLKDKFEIVSIESESDIYTITYLDDGESYSVTITSDTVQILQMDDSDSSEYLYCYKKVTKNLWYYLTEMDPQERVIYLIY